MHMHMGSLREEEEDSSFAAKSGRFLRLEHILGGKSRRGVHRPSEGCTFLGESKLEEANKQSTNRVQGVNIDETMVEASTNSCISDNVHPDDLGLEIAMKQLMEATHDALVNMKGDDLKAKRADLQQSSEQRAALTQEALQRISPKRLEQSVAVVRGWLQSPTPSECSYAAPGERRKTWTCNVPIPTLVSSLKEEAKVFATPPPPPPPHHKNCSSKAAGDLQEVQQEPKRNININMYKENAAAVARAPHQGKEGIPHKTVREKRPALRILKPKNFKISDLLVSDSEEELEE